MTQYPQSSSHFHKMRLHATKSPFGVLATYRSGQLNRAPQSKIATGQADNCTKSDKHAGLETVSFYDAHLQLRTLLLVETHQGVE